MTPKAEKSEMKSFFLLLKETFKGSRKKEDTAPHLSVGKFGEDAAVRYLKRHGYKIIDRNVRMGHSELDVICVKDKTLVFVEVKSRVYDPEDTENYSRPADAVNREKVTYLIRGANRFIKENRALVYDYFKRFDLIEVYLHRKGDKLKVNEIKHFENAVRRR